MFLDEIPDCSTLAVFHGDIDGDIFFIDFEVEVLKDVDVVHSDESVDLLDDVLFLFGGDSREGHLFDDDRFVGLFILCFEKVVLFRLENVILVI